MILFSEIAILVSNNSIIIKIIATPSNLNIVILFLKNALLVSNNIINDNVKQPNKCNSVLKKLHSCLKNMKVLILSWVAKKFFRTKISSHEKNV